MLTIAQEFSRRTESVIALLDIVAAAIVVAKADHKKIKTRAPFVVLSKKLKNAVLANADFQFTALDGPYLTLCAEYEMTIRNLIEKFVLDAVQKCPEYHHLPREMREWYPDGCSKVILDIKQDKFSHLTKEQLVRSLASSLKNREYNLLGEVFSYNQINFWPEIVEDTLSKRLGLLKIWQKLSRDTTLQGIIGTTVLATVERQLKEKLGKIMQKRNDIIHRGRNYCTSSDSEVREAAKILKGIVDALAKLMEQYLDSL